MKCRILTERKEIDYSTPSSDLCQKLTRVDDAVDEYFAWYQAVVILIHLAEQVGEAGFLVVHELQELDEWKEKAVSGTLSESSR